MRQNKFYKQAWFYFLIAGILLSAISILGLIYTDYFNDTTAFALLAGGVFLTLLGAVFSFFSFQPTEPTLKTLKGRDLGIKMDDLKDLNDRELLVVFSMVTGVPMTDIQMAIVGGDPIGYKKALKQQEISNIKSANKEQKQQEQALKNIPKQQEKEFQEYYKKQRQDAMRAKLKVK